METFTKLFGSLLLFVYHCFDRVVINGYLSGLSRPGQVAYFFQNVVGEPVIAKEVLCDLEVRVEKIGARMEVGDLPTIEADPMQMRQLLLNLIGNSLKFQPPDATPVVKIQARILSSESATDTAFLGQLPATGQPAAALEQFCEISVQDNGIGFDEKYTDKIFAVFQRLHGRNEYEGTGVGLAVCRRIADRHHGTIIAKSKLGQGATFIVTLPLRQAAPPSPL